MSRPKKQITKSDAERALEYRQKQKLCVLQRSRATIITRDKTTLYSVAIFNERGVTASFETWRASIVQNYDLMEKQMLRWRHNDHPAAFQDGYEIVYRDLDLSPITIRRPKIGSAHPNDVVHIWAPLTSLSRCPRAGLPRRRPAAKDDVKTMYGGKEVTIEDYRRYRRRRLPRCMPTVPLKKNLRRPLGAIVSIIPAKAVDISDWRSDLS